MIQETSFTFEVETTKRVGRKTKVFEVKALSSFPSEVAGESVSPVPLRNYRPRKGPYSETANRVLFTNGKNQPLLFFPAGRFGFLFRATNLARAVSDLFAESHGPKLGCPDIGFLT